MDVFRGKIRKTFLTQKNKIFYWSPAFRICMGCLLKYERNLLKIGFKHTYFQVFQRFPALKETVAHIQPNGQFWTVFGQNGQNRIFFKKALGKFLSRLKALINCKVSEKSNEGIPRKMGKTSIFGHFGPKWPILDSFWPKWAKREFFQKSAWNIFLALTSPNKLQCFRKK